MKRIAQLNAGLILGFALAATPLRAADTDGGVPDIQISGQSLAYWVDEAGRNSGPRDVSKTVAALGQAVGMEDPTIKVVAADALALLGTDAKQVMSQLTEQLGHEQPLVRVAAMGALASMGKEAVPTLAAMVRDQTGGPRIRAAFILAGIGPDAKSAVPVLAKVMNEETPAMAARFRGILSAIDPVAFPPNSTVKQAQYDPASADIAVAQVAQSSDWPQFHGPRRDALCQESGLLRQWPDGGPELLWTLEGLGSGYSTVAIADGRLLTMGDRGEGEEETQMVIALDLDSREELWSTSIGLPHQDGPRCTPTIDGARVYVIGTEGDLVCLAVDSGEEQWRKSLPNDFGGQMMSGWKFSESPLVDGNQVVCTPGGSDAAMVALDKVTGQTIWQCGLPDIGESGADGAAYSSIVAATIHGTRQYVQLLGRGVIGVDARSGRLLWSYNRVANNVANCTAPLVRGDYVFATTAYNTGSALLKIVPADDAWEAQEVYFIPPKEFMNHHGGVVLVGDHLYGGHGPNKGDPACIDFGSGEVIWKERAPARGSAAVLYADGHLVFRYDRGEVVLMEATPDGLRIKGQFETPREKGAAWAHPVIHQGRLYLRHANTLLCYDLRAEE